MRAVVAVVNAESKSTPNSTSIVGSIVMRPAEEKKKKREEEEVEERFDAQRAQHTSDD